MIYSEEEILFPEKFTYQRMTDDSMEPQIPEGAVVTIRNVETNEDIHQADPRVIYYVEINHLRKELRYLLRLDNKLIMLPVNREYGYELYDLDENLIVVLGTVQSWYCDLRV